MQSKLQILSNKSSTIGVIVMFKEIQKNKKLYMLIVEQIKELIENGKLKPGEKLPSERELSNQFGLSRSTVREALTALEILGLVEVHTGLGTFVSKETNQKDFIDSYLDIEEGISPTEIFEARRIIEPQLARLAAQRATMEDIEEIKRNIEEAEVLSNEQIEEFEKLDEEFHLLVAKASYNEVLYKFAESINNMRNSRLWGNMKLRSLQRGDRIPKYKTEHREIYEALSKRDLKAAEILTKKHLSDIRYHLFEDVN